MKLSHLGASLFLAASLLASPCLAADLPASGRLDPAQATELYAAQKDGLVILDVRTDAEFNAGHAEGALHIPVDQLPSRVQEVPADNPVLIICRSGVRASNAFKILRKAGRPAEQLWFLSGYTDYANGVPTFHK